jgi:hypothetical protein
VGGSLFSSASSIYEESLTASEFSSTVSSLSDETYGIAVSARTTIRRLAMAKFEGQTFWMHTFVPDRISYAVHLAWEKAKLYLKYGPILALCRDDLEAILILEASGGACARLGSRQEDEKYYKELQNWARDFLVEAVLGAYGEHENVEDVAAYVEEQKRLVESRRKAVDQTLVNAMVSRSDRTSCEKDADSAYQYLEFLYTAI